MEEYFTAFQTVLRNRRDEALFVVSTYYSDGNWCTRVYRCDPSGECDWTKCVDKDWLGDCSPDHALSTHLEYTERYSPLL